MINKLLLVSAIIVASLLTGCEDDPTSLGSNLLPEQDRINVIGINNSDSTFFEKSSFYIDDTLKLNSSTKLLLGKSGNVQSTMLMRFIMFLPDSIKEAIRENSLTVRSAKINMHPTYRYGDENGIFKMEVNKITSDWNSLEFTRYDLPNLTYDDINLSSNMQNDGDSLITLDFDKTTTYDWMKLATDGIQEENYGVYFNYTDDTDKILGFPGIGTLDDSLLTKMEIIVEVANQFVDTLTIPVTSDIHVVLGELPTTNNESLFIQGGIPVYSKMFFDLSKLPSMAIINKATLTLTVDQDESVVGTSSFNLIKLDLLDNYEENSLNTTFFSINIGIDSSKTYYSGDITPFIQYWISKENEGVRLSFYDEIETVNKVAIISQKNADKALRPYLEIIYTAKN